MVISRQYIFLHVILEVVVVIENQWRRKQEVETVSSSE